MGERPGNGEALLLTTGQCRGEHVEPVLDFIPERGLTQALFDQRVEFRYGSVHARVIVNAGVDPRFPGGYDTVLTQSLFSLRPMCACMRLDLAMFAGEVTTEPAQLIEPTQR